MLSQPEYEAHSKDLEQFTQDLINKLKEDLLKAARLVEAVKLAQLVTNKYYEQVRIQLDALLHEVGFNAANHYNDMLALGHSSTDLNKIVDTAIKDQHENSYYGLTLDQRVDMAHRALKYNIIRSSMVGRSLGERKHNITRAWLERIPFGAHINIDKRLFLSQSVNLEHDIAKLMGDSEQFVIWKLSDRHSEVDICDDLSAQSPYRLSKVPEIPHPNCRCTLVFLTEEGKELRAPIKRTRDKIINLVKRLFRRKTNT